MEFRSPRRCARLPSQYETPFLRSRPVHSVNPDEKPAITERTPEAVLDFWLGPLRTAADTSRKNWQEGMLRWRMGPLVRSAENSHNRRVQRDLCEQMHREGPDRFFLDPAWDTPQGFLAKLIVLDQFPRNVYRGTALAYANDAVTAAMTLQACEDEREFEHYNVIERFWIYVPLSHAEDLKLQELAIDKFSRWSTDLVAEAPPERRRINQFVSWSFVRAVIEHSETLLLFDRFPHRNAAMLRPHRGGEPRYLKDAMRPLWTFTQPPDPDYIALLGALRRMRDRRMGDGADENRITREALAGLLRAAGLSPEDPASPMDVFTLAGGDAVPYPLLYQHLRLTEHARTLGILRQVPPVADLLAAVKRILLRNGGALSAEELVWPPKNAKHSVEPVIDVASLIALVDGGPVGARASETRDGSGPRGSLDGREPPAGRHQEAARSLGLSVANDLAELERVAAAVNEFAYRHRFREADRFQVQLCIEEVLMYLVEHGYDDDAAHRIEIDLELNVEVRRLEIRIVDDGRQLDLRSHTFQPSADTIEEESVVDGLGLNLVRTYVDDIVHRRVDGRNHLSLSKNIGI